MFFQLHFSNNIKLIKKRTSYSGVYEMFVKKKNQKKLQSYSIVVITSIFTRTQRFRLRIVEIGSYFLIGLVNSFQQWIVKIRFHGNRHRSFDAVRNRQFVINHDEERITVIIRQRKILTIYAGRSESIEHGIQIDIWLVRRLSASSFRLRYWRQNSEGYKTNIWKYDELVSKITRIIQSNVLLIWYFTSIV